MKKWFILLLTLIVIQISASAEVIPPRGSIMTKETHPVFWSYLENYSNSLKKAFEASHMFRLRGFGASYYFIITPDGEIKDMRNKIYQNKYFNEKVKEIILSVKPEPFYKDMEADDLFVSVFLGYAKYDDLSINLGWHPKYEREIFNITIILNK